VYSGPFTISRACQELLLIRRNGTPHPRPCQSTGQACCSVHRRERFKTVPYKDFGHPRKRDFAGLNLHLGIFDQPGESEFFNRIFGFDPFGAVRLRLKEGAKKCRSGATLIKFRSSGQEIVGLTLGGASLIKFKS